MNRYIHDFEAMLRRILADRDGSPLGVTILSSDMGKLYVALAQAIERLRKAQRPGGLSPVEHLDVTQPNT